MQAACRKACCLRRLWRWRHGGRAVGGASRRQGDVRKAWGSLQDNVDTPWRWAVTTMRPRMKVAVTETREEQHQTRRVGGGAVATLTRAVGGAGTMEGWRHTAWVPLCAALMCWVHCCHHIYVLDGAHKLGRQLNGSFIWRITSCRAESVGSRSRPAWRADWPLAEAERRLTRRIYMSWDSVCTVESDKVV